MYSRALLFASLLMTVSPAHAGSDFGTREEAKKLAIALIDIVNTQGIEAAVQAVYDPDQEFVGTRMGVNLFQGSSVIADNREPEMVAADYSETQDLKGDFVWPLVSAAADRQDDVVLKWYHYDTQEIYDFHCYSMRAERDDAAVMICR